MTPDERQMIEEVFQRLSQNAGALDKDYEADRFIADMMRRNPDAAYMMTQTLLVYEHQLTEQTARIAELEAKVAPARSTGGSFLGGRVPTMASRSTSTSVPPVGGNYGADASSPWGNATRSADTSGSRIGSARNAQSDGFNGRGSGADEREAPRAGMFGGGRAPQGPPPSQMGQPVPGQAQGGGFFRSAMATAAGVAGGMMIANSLGSLFGGGDAKAAEGASDTSTADANAAQDAQQDAELESEWASNDAQDTEQDDAFGGFDGGDFEA